MKNNILIIGGGPAGLEASAQLQRMGYNVILIEKSPKLGGHLAKWDRLFPDSVQADEVLGRLLKGAEGVKCFTDTDVRAINRLDKSYNVRLTNGITVLSDVVLVASGFDLFDAVKKEEYGYGIYDQVMTNADLEAYFKSGSDRRIEKPGKIGFAHCVGSRDEKSGCRSCSKVCCATAVKQAIEMKQTFPDAEVFCFYMDLRLFGRHYEDIYLKAQKEYGVRFIRGRVAEVSENYDGTLLVKAEDTVAGKPLKVTLDLLVLMAGMRPSASGKAIGDLLEMSVEEDGYFAVRSGIAAGQRSPIPGIFLAGAATGPKTLPETLADARAAAMEVDRYLTEIFPDAKNYKQLVRERW